MMIFEASILLGQLMQQKGKIAVSTNEAASQLFYKHKGSIHELQRKLSLVNTAPGACTIKLVTTVIYGFL
jgi:hypothetical protein